MIPDNISYMSLPVPTASSSITCVSVYNIEKASIRHRDTPRKCQPNGCRMMDI